MKKSLILLSLLSLMVACNFLGMMNPAANNSVSTQVSAQLTSSPIVIATIVSEESTSQPTEVLVPTETQTPIPTITETPTLSPDDPRIKLGNPTWKESFEKANQNFYQYEDDLVQFVYDTGDLVMRAKIPMGGTYWSMS